MSPSVSKWYNQDYKSWWPKCYKRSTTFLISAVAPQQSNYVFNTANFSCFGCCHIRED